MCQSAHSTAVGLSRRSWLDRLIEDDPRFGGRGQAFLATTADLLRSLGLGLTRRLPSGRLCIESLSVGQGLDFTF